MLNRRSFLVLLFTVLSMQSFADFNAEDSNGQLLAGNWSSWFHGKEEHPPAPPPKKNEIPALLELKAGYFFFYDTTMSKVFRQGGFDLQLCGSAPLWQWLQIYGSVEFLEKEGDSLNGGQNTRIWEVPLTLGLEAVAVINKKAHYYFMIGPRYFFVHVHNRSDFVNRRLSDNGLGGVLGTGFHFFPYTNFVIDLFGEISYCRLHFHTHKENVRARSVQVGGCVFGGGLGYAF